MFTYESPDELGTYRYYRPSARVKLSWELTDGKDAEQKSIEIIARLNFDLKYLDVAKKRLSRGFYVSGRVGDDLTADFIVSPSRKSVVASLPNRYKDNDLEQNIADAIAEATVKQLGL